jgi:N-acetylmuramoyl-L-alanine amidase
MMRERDENLGLADRAKVAKDNNSNLFLSIHFNASRQHNARGVETLVDRRARNTNHAADVAYARLIQKAVFNAIKAPLLGLFICEIMAKPFQA